jgi:ferredoxin
LRVRLVHSQRATLRLRGVCFRSISVTFIDRDGERIACRAPIGQNLLEVAHANNVDLEARRRAVAQASCFLRLTRRAAQGACEGSLACSTCHVIVEDPAYFARLKARDGAVWPVPPM